MHKEVVTKRIQIKKTPVKYKYRQGIPRRYLSVSKKSVAFPHAVAHAYLGEDVLGLAGRLLDLAADIAMFTRRIWLSALALGPHSSRMMKS